MRCSSSQQETVNLLFDASDQTIPWFSHQEASSIPKKVFSKSVQGLVASISQGKRAFFESYENINNTHWIIIEVCVRTSLSVNITVEISEKKELTERIYVPCESQQNQNGVKKGQWVNIAFQLASLFGISKDSLLYLKGIEIKDDCLLNTVITSSNIPENLHNTYSLLIISENIKLSDIINQDTGQQQKHLKQTYRSAEFNNSSPQGVFQQQEQLQQQPIQSLVSQQQQSNLSSRNLPLSCRSSANDKITRVVAEKMKKSSKFRSFSIYSELSSRSSSEQLANREGLISTKNQGISGLQQTKSIPYCHDSDNASNRSHSQFEQPVNNCNTARSKLSRITCISRENSQSIKAHTPQENISLGSQHTVHPRNPLQPSSSSSKRSGNSFRQSSSKPFEKFLHRKRACSYLSSGTPQTTYSELQENLASCLPSSIPVLLPLNGASQMNSIDLLPCHASFMEKSSMMEDLYNIKEQQQQQMQHFGSVLSSSIESNPQNGQFLRSNQTNRRDNKENESKTSLEQKQSTNKFSKGIKIIKNPARPGIHSNMVADVISSQGNIPSAIKNPILFSRNLRSGNDIISANYKHQVISSLPYRLKQAGGSNQNRSSSFNIEKYDIDSDFCIPEVFPKKFKPTWKAHRNVNTKQMLNQSLRDSIDEVQSSNLSSRNKRIEISSHRKRSPPLELSSVIEIAQKKQNTNNLKIKRNNVGASIIRGCSPQSPNRFDNTKQIDIINCQSNENCNNKVKSNSCFSKKRESLKTALSRKIIPCLVSEIVQTDKQAKIDLNPLAKNQELHRYNNQKNCSNNSSKDLSLFKEILGMNLEHTEEEKQHEKHLGYLKDLSRFSCSFQLSDQQIMPCMVSQEQITAPETKRDQSCEDEMIAEEIERPSEVVLSEIQKTAGSNFTKGIINSSSGSASSGSMCESQVVLSEIMNNSQKIYQQKNNQISLKNQSGIKQKGIIESMVSQTVVSESALSENDRQELQIINSERMIRSGKLLIKESTPCKLKKSSSLKESNMLGNIKIEDSQYEIEQIDKFDQLREKEEEMDINLKLQEALIIEDRHINQNQGIGLRQLLKNAMLCPAII